jgi:hypothetical protein
MEQCARTSGMHLIPITKNWQIITKVLEIIPIFRDCFLRRKKGSIYLVISIKSVTMPFKHFKVRRPSMFFSTCEMWMLKEMEFINHLQKKHRMRMMTFSHKTMSQIKVQIFNLMQELQVSSTCLRNQQNHCQKKLTKQQPISSCH